MARFVNHVEYLRKNTFTTLRQGVIDLYDNTGKEESKFFPLLNYAAMRMMLARDYDGCEQRAAEWINEYLEYLITSATPSIVDANFTVLSVLKQDTVKDSLIKLGKFTNIGWQFANVSLIMEFNGSDIESTRHLIDIWSTVLLSVEYAISDIFGKTLSNRKKELDTFPSMKHVLRSIKEYKAQNAFEAQTPLMLMVDEICKRCGNDVIFPIIPHDHFYFGGKACLCHYNADSGLCTLFNKSKIARVNSLWALSVTETDETTARNLLQEYKSGVEHLTRIIENVEKCRNTLLSLR